MRLKIDEVLFHDVGGPNIAARKGVKETKDLGSDEKTIRKASTVALLSLMVVNNRSWAGNRNNRRCCRGTFQIRLFQDFLTAPAVGSCLFVPKAGATAGLPQVSRGS